MESRRKRPYRVCRVGGFSGPIRRGGRDQGTRLRAVLVQVCGELKTDGRGSRYPILSRWNSERMGHTHLCEIKGAPPATGFRMKLRLWYPRSASADLGYPATMGCSCRLCRGSIQPGTRHCNC